MCNGPRRFVAAFVTLPHLHDPGLLRNMLGRIRSLLSRNRLAACTCSQRARLASSSAPAATTRAAFEHCAQLVRQHDRDNFPWILQLPADLRSRVLALRAFNLETLLIGEHVKSREPGIIQIRFQWWRDAVSRLNSSNTPDHPVLLALSDVHKTTPLRSYNLKRILDAREADVMSSQPPLTLGDLEQYAESTASQLLYLQLATAGVANKDADHAASHVGKAVGITTLLRGTGYHASQRRCYLPIELCAEHGLSQEELYRGVVSEPLKDVALAVAAVARAHLRHAQEMASKLPPPAAHMMLPAVMAGYYLEALEKAEFNVLDPSLAAGAVSPLRYLLALKWHYWRGTF